MKTVNVAICIYAIALTSIFVGCKVAAADEPKKEPVIVQDFVQCTYKPSPSDTLVVHCESLKGKGTMSIKICGVNYTVDIICA